MDRALKLDQLIDGAEELLINLTDAHDPQVQRLRDRVDHAIRDARRNFAHGNAQPPPACGDVVRSIDDQLHDHPWRALAAGMLLAGTVTFLTGYLLGFKRGARRTWV